MADRPKVGLTLPTFVDDPEALAAVARAADDADTIDAVFTYDHVYRIGSAGARPALALEPTLGLLATATDRVAFGPLVARATLRRPAAAQALFDTVARIAPGRLIAAVGTGDSLSAAENRAMGLPEETAGDRLAALEATVDALGGRGYPVWVGGRSEPVLAAAATRADGWNGWNLDLDAFEAAVSFVAAAAAAAGRPAGAVAPSWGGLIELRPSRWDAVEDRADVLSGSFDAMAERLRGYGAAGAEWLVLAPVAPADPDNAAAVAAELIPLLA